MLKYYRNIVIEYCIIIFLSVFHLRVEQLPFCAETPGKKQYSHDLQLPWKLARSAPFKILRKICP